MTPSESSPSINPRTLRGIGQLLKAEALGLLRTCWRAFWCTTLIIAAPIALYCLHSPSATRPGDDLAGLGISLFLGALVGLVAAVLMGLWRLFGGWMVVPMIVTPLVFMGLGWLFSGLVDWQTDNFWRIVAQHPLHHSARDFMGTPSGPGGIFFVVMALPLLLVNAIFILLTPKVLLHLALLVLIVGSLILLSALLTLVLCLPVLGWSMVKRIQSRNVFSRAVTRPLSSQMERYGEWTGPSCSRGRSTSMCSPA
ncbi:MAG TPA: hypothetical protein VF794_19790 [Archangium sp.]|jgi:hypothetical protein|uniref:hypothetical protein n=1 Tax=Archangium sp. TaxID=1872627 RepID=UPI002ED8EBDB